MSFIYISAAKILKQFDNKQSGMKTLVYNSNVKAKKSVYALACETYKYMNIIMEIINNTRDLSKQMKKVDKYVLYIMIYELLFGKKVINGGGKVKKLILNYKNMLNEQLIRLKIKKGVASNEDLLPKEIKNMIKFPRYVRVNTIKASVETVLEILRKQGLNDVKLDELIPNLLIFPTGTDFHDHPMVKDGHIILQDKASCFSAFALISSIFSKIKNTKEDLIQFIDACAAPGNKTTHLASLISKNCRIDAFERDKKRFNLLNRMIEKAGAQNVNTHNQDFMTCDWNSEKFANVRGILVDPTCSGSGMIHRLEYNQKNDDEEYLKKLADFQTSILNHALSAPFVSNVVYSTCSIHQVENEDVVERALKAHPEFELITILEDWPRRGLGNFNACLRVDPRKDNTNGFFVACFQRKSSLNQPLGKRKLDTTNNVQQPKKKKRKKKKKKKKNNNNN